MVHESIKSKLIAYFEEDDFKAIFSSVDNSCPELKGDCSKLKRRDFEINRDANSNIITREEYYRLKSQLSDAVFFLIERASNQLAKK